MLDLFLIGIWITYAAILILNYLNHRRISRQEKELQKQVATMVDQVDTLIALNKFKQLSGAEKLKLSHQWLSQCAKNGVKTPYSEYVIQQMKEVDNG